MADPAPTPAQERRIAVLGEMAEVGLRLTQALERHVLAAERTQANVARTDPDAMILPACDLEAVARAFNRISRAVRMTLALQARLEKPPCRSSDRQAPPDRHPAERAVRALAARLLAGERDGESTESLVDPDDLAGLLNAPLPETIAFICRDLRLSARQSARVQAAFAALPPDEIPRLGDAQAAAEATGPP